MASGRNEELIKTFTYPDLKDRATLTWSRWDRQRKGMFQEWPAAARKEELIEPSRTRP